MGISSLGLTEVQTPIGLKDGPQSVLSLLYDWARDMHTPRTPPREGDNCVFYTIVSNVFVRKFLFLKKLLPTVEM